MMRKVLIANRGEIACRIIQTCHAMGLRTVAIYSDADADALHVEMADEAVHVGGSAPADSYLNGDAILGAARLTNADAIHPGYGFLAENAEFAYHVRAARLTWIGPPPEAIEAMGNKRIAKLVLEDVPFVPGYIGEDQRDETLIAAAVDIGYPIMVKAAAGGGGKGMRLVHNAAHLPDALAAARREAQNAFGDATLMLEKAVEAPRHIEIQIFGDRIGNIISLGERECSIQRRHQKIIEEAPSSAINPQMRAAMSQTAVRIGEQLGYTSAGTVEFLVDGDGNYYFMEMNTRLQVEHPVTEAIYDIDLVRWQIEAARGLTLPEIVPVEEIDLFYRYASGHAIEARVYAEDPANDFLPVTGAIAHWRAPGDVRVDSGIRSGDTITPYYDPLLAKVIAHGRTRTEAIRRLERALSRLELFGLRSNQGYLRRVLNTPEHLAGIIDTTFVDEFPELKADPADVPALALLAAAIARADTVSGWRNNPNRPTRQTFSIGAGETVTVELQGARDGSLTAAIGEQTHAVQVKRLGEDRFALTVDGHRQPVTARYVGDVCWVHTLTGTIALPWVTPLPAPAEADEISGSLRAPMPGQVIAVRVQAAQRVQKGDLLLILEAMKMEHRIEAPYAGVVEAVHFNTGDAVEQDDILLSLAEDE